jgi:hypothetical protein
MSSTHFWMFGRRVRGLERTRGRYIPARCGFAPSLRNWRIEPTLVGGCCVTVCLCLLPSSTIARCYGAASATFRRASSPKRAGGAHGWWSSRMSRRDGRSRSRAELVPVELVVGRSRGPAVGGCGGGTAEEVAGQRRSGAAALQGSRRTKNQFSLSCKVLMSKRQRERFVYTNFAYF